MKKEKLLRRIAASPRNVRFVEFQSFAVLFGFRLDRISGSHHIYVHPKVPELVNIQNVKGKAKPYQIKQLLSTIERYRLHAGE